jgi:GTP 3',8-cyclase
MNAHTPLSVAPPLVDPFGRAITYLRVSATDRCDFRCVYCMSEDMNFLPKRDVLTLEELDRVCSAFIALGTRKLRITGGEPLVRRDVMRLFQSLSRYVCAGALDELTLTTNGSQLARYAAELADCGVRRVNVSLDTLDAKKFRAITRWGDLEKVLAGIDAAQAAGLTVKINVVALKGVNDEEAFGLVAWAHGRGMELTFIEVMPLGEIEVGRAEQYLPLTELRAKLSTRLTLTPSAFASGGRRGITTSPRRKGASASSPRSPIISAKAAIGSASLAPARFTCAWARTTQPTCAHRCVNRIATRPSTRRSDRRSRGSPKAMISLSIERFKDRPWRAT